MLAGSYDEDRNILLNVEDGLYYLNAGHKDIKQWNGIEYQIQGEDIDGNPRTYT